MVPTLILGTFQLIADRFLLTKEPVVVAPGADIIAAMENFIAVFSSGIITGSLTLLVVHVLDAMILRTDIDKTVKGQSRGIKVRPTLQGIGLFARIHGKRHLLSPIDCKQILKIPSCLFNTFFRDFTNHLSCSANSR